MKIKNLLFFLIVFIVSCDENNELKNSANQHQFAQKANTPKNTIDYTKAKAILREKEISLEQLIKYFKISKTKHTHHKIIGGSNSNIAMANIPVFSGYNKLHAFSSNGYPRKSKPTDYHHFLLYIYEYQDRLKAKEIFGELEKIVNTGSLNGMQGNKETDELSNAAYFGGFICLKKNFIIWKVETCTIDYKNTDPINEFKLLKFLYNKDELATINLFNSDCGTMLRTYNYFTFFKTYSRVLKQKK